MKFHSLDQQAVQIIQRYLGEEKKLISIFQQIDAQRVYRELGYSSLFQYCVERHKLSESRAYELIYVSRKCTEVPQLKTAIEIGSVSISAAKRIGSVVTPDNADLWIEQASTLKQKDLERVVAVANPQAAVRERIKPVAEGRSVVIVGASTRLEKKILRIREIVAQNLASPCSLEQTLEEMADVFLERKDPVVRAERIAKRKAARAAALVSPAKQATSLSKVPVESRVEPSACLSKVGSEIASSLRSSQRLGSRRAIPAAVRHQVVLRDQARCQGHTPDGKLCESRQWIDIHHIRPVSLGGTNDLENLITLCRHHHREEHRHAG